MIANKTLPMVGLSLHPEILENDVKLPSGRTLTRLERCLFSKSLCLRQLNKINNMGNIVNRNYWVLGTFCSYTKQYPQVYIKQHGLKVETVEILLLRQCMM